jgi:hypothetical protein
VHEGHRGGLGGGCAFVLARSRFKSTGRYVAVRGSTSGSTNATVASADVHVCCVCALQGNGFPEQRQDYSSKGALWVLH